MLEKLFGPGPISTTSNPAGWFLNWIGAGIRNASGQAVNEESALSYSAINCATRVISETIASLPAKTYYVDELGKRHGEARDNQAAYVLRCMPNYEQDAMTFWDFLISQAILHGNGYAEIERTGDGRVARLWPIHSSRVMPRRDFETKQLFYQVTPFDGRVINLLPEDMLNIIGPMSPNGVQGRGVLHYARNTIGTGVAMERFKGAFFARGAAPSGVLTTDQNLRDPKSEKYIRQLRRDWEKRYGGADNAARVAVLHSGLNFKPLSCSPVDSQLLEQSSFQILEVARFFRMPPHFLADLSGSTFNNIEQQSLNFLVHCLRPWLERIEARVDFTILQDPGLEFEFDTNALLRTDVKTRTEVGKDRFNNGFWNIDEWRESEGLDPVSDPTKHFMPMNLTTMDRILDGANLKKDVPEPLASDRFAPSTNGHSH